MSTIKNKRILDSVHGYVIIPEDVCRNIVDTIQFQRLRRVEQMSIRSLFPCARHDRFTHSLGVYHLGCKIVEAVKNSGEVFPDNDGVVYESYKLACLLHDVGHSPFSHTFEEFFRNKNNLCELLKQELTSSSFLNDYDISTNFNKTSPHEEMSAYVVLKVYKDFISEKGADVEMIVRMITGCKYTDREKSFENAFIDLLHGDIIDADRLDYVIRDTWSSGYSASNVDAERLVNGISIHRKNQESQWEVCYSPKTLNEIESVLSVKDFQINNAVSHHTVVLEQYILKESMKSAAMLYFGIKPLNDEDSRKNALIKLCNVKTLVGEINGNPLHFPSDDDFVALLKQYSDDKFIKQWLSRQYDYVPLWKSRAEFHVKFPIMLKKKYNKNFWLFVTDCKKFINVKFGINISDILILEAKNSSYHIVDESVKFYIDGQIVPYDEIYFKESNVLKADPIPFFYIYIPKKCNDRIPEILAALKEQVDEHAAPLEELFKSQFIKFISDKIKY